MLRAIILRPPTESISHCHYNFQKCASFMLIASTLFCSSVFNDIGVFVGRERHLESVFVCTEKRLVSVFIQVASRYWENFCPQLCWFYPLEGLTESQ